MNCPICDKEMSGYEEGFVGWCRECFQNHCPKCKSTNFYRNNICWCCACKDCGYSSGCCGGSVPGSPDVRKFMGEALKYRIDIVGDFVSDTTYFRRGDDNRG